MITQYLQWNAFETSKPKNKSTHITYSYSYSYQKYFSYIHKQIQNRPFQGRWQIKWKHFVNTDTLNTGFVVDNFLFRICSQKCSAHIQCWRTHTVSVQTCRSFYVKHLSVVSRAKCLSLIMGASTSKCQRLSPLIQHTTSKQWWKECMNVKQTRLARNSSLSLFLSCSQMMLI